MKFKFSVIRMCNYVARSTNVLYLKSFEIFFIEIEDWNHLKRETPKLIFSGALPPEKSFFDLESWTVKKKIFHLTVPVEMRFSPCILNGKIVLFSF